MKVPDDARLLVPARAESEDGQFVGDGMMEIGPEHPMYADWVEWLEEQDSIVASVKIID